MSQFSLDFSATAGDSLTSLARKRGAWFGDLAADRAEREAGDFKARAAKFVLSYLAAHGVSSGELITDACKLSGIRPPDDRAFGPVYASLARANHIECAGFVARRKGHGTAGGRLWRLIAEERPTLATPVQGEEHGVAHG